MIDRRGLLALALALAMAPLTVLADPPKKTPTKSSRQSKTPTKKRTARTNRTPSSKPASQPASEPAEPVPPQGETIGYTIRRLRRVGAKQLKEGEVATLAALEFCSAIAGCDSVKVADALDATGFQPLPLEGALPYPPVRPMLPVDLTESFKARTAVSIDEVLLEKVQIVKRAGVEHDFPAVAEWMLPGDHAAVLDPDPQTPGWVTRRCVVVIRVRGRRPWVMGGNILTALGVG